MTKQLFITADDYGVHNSIDRGIEKCIDANAVDCVAIIVTHSSSETRIKHLLSKYQDRIENGSLSLGLHLSLNCGTPQFRDNPHYLKAIEKNGVFKYNSGAKIYLKIKKLAVEHTTSLRKEMEMQYKKFVSIVGTKPAHMSSHTGIYQSKELYPLYSKFCMDNNLHMRNPTLLYYSGMPKWQDNPEQYMASMIARAFGMIAKPKVIKWQRSEIRDVLKTNRANGLKTTDHFIEHFFRNGNIKALTAILDKLVDKSYEMVIHPMHFTNESFKDSLPSGINRKFLTKRRSEMETIVNGSIAQLLADRGIEIYKLEKPNKINGNDLIA